MNSGSFFQGLNSALHKIQEKLITPLERPHKPQVTSYPVSHWKNSCTSVLWAWIELGLTLCQIERYPRHYTPGISNISNMEQTALGCWAARVFCCLLQADLFSTTLYDLVHPEDVEKVRDQLSTTESQNTGRILDLKSKSLQPSLLFPIFINSYSINSDNNNNDNSDNIQDERLWVQALFLCDCVDAYVSCIFCCYLKHFFFFTIPACHSFMCFFNRGETKGTNSSKILFDVCVCFVLCNLCQDWLFGFGAICGLMTCVQSK